MTSLTQDAFLGGRLQLWQPKQGYRAGIEPVLLAASTRARAGQTVLELGCGVATASLCLGRRVPGVKLIGVEIMPQYARLAERNALDNQIDMEIVQSDLAALPTRIRAMSFDHVLANPPFFDRKQGSRAEDAGRDHGRAGPTPLAMWLRIGAQRLRPRGELTMIIDASQLVTLLSALPTTLGSVTIIPLAARAGRDARLIIVRATKLGRAMPRLCAPVILHRGATHLRDGDDYTPEIAEILRNGAALGV